MTTNQKPLRRSKAALFHIVDGKRVEGPSPQMSGDCTDLSGDCTYLRGYCSGLRGNLSDIPMSARPCNLSDWVEAGA